MPAWFVFCFVIQLVGSRPSLIPLVRFDAAFLALYCLVSSNNDAYTIVCKSCSLAKLNMVCHSLSASHTVSVNYVIIFNISRLSKQRPALLSTKFYFWHHSFDLYFVL